MSLPQVEWKKDGAAYVSKCGRGRIERDAKPGWTFTVDGTLNPFLWPTLARAKEGAASLLRLYPQGAKAVAEVFPK
jgi:hypothetical protein